MRPKHAWRSLSLVKLVIEIDGDSHFSVEGRAKDEERTNILEGYGLKVIRFTNDEVLHNMKVLLDTNIWISGLLWGGNPRKIIQLAVEEQIVLS